MRSWFLVFCTGIVVVMNLFAHKEFPVGLTIAIISFLWALRGVEA